MLAPRPVLPCRQSRCATDFRSSTKLSWNLTAIYRSNESPSEFGDLVTGKKRILTDSVDWTSLATSTESQRIPLRWFDPVAIVAVGDTCSSRLAGLQRHNPNAAYLLVIPRMGRDLTFRIRDGQPVTSWSAFDGP